MNFEDEKDYLMRIIKEWTAALMSFIMGRSYTSVEQELENGYEVSGCKLEDLLKMIDDGDINSAENQLLDGIDYGKKEELAAAALFYQYLSEKDDAFLEKNDFSGEEVLDGMKNIIYRSGYGDLIDFMVDE